LDEGDNDPVRFLSYLVAAIGRVVEEEGFGEAVVAALNSPEPPPTKALVGALVNEVAALPDGLDLVLDDYHAIDSEEVYEIVRLVLDHLPEGVHLVVSSRADPPLSLARLRARGQMAEVGAIDLAFTREEVLQFLKGVMDLDPSTEDVVKLEGRTEGWIAGLQLAALSMRDREDVSGFVEIFSGSHRDVLDFLAEEVLERQAEEVRGFLLSTSVLERMSAPLCDALTERDDGQRMLEDLERENLFVVPLDDERGWYRYHHLFADFLRGRLWRDNPERVEGLHRVAASHGAGAAQALVRAGLLDEMEIHLVPVLLGGGRRLFDHLGPEHIELERTRILEGRAVSPTCTTASSDDVDQRETRDPGGRPEGGEGARGTR
jgi:LuxR family transcriptional regulator, maltose regulon positive regulatory protein